MQVGEAYKDQAFRGPVTLWFRADPVEHLEVRWTSSGRAARVPFLAIFRACGMLAEEALELAIQRLQEEWPGTLDEFDEAVEGGVTPINAWIEDPSPLILEHAKELADGRWNSAIGDHLGTWSTLMRGNEADSELATRWCEAGKPAPIFGDGLGQPFHPGNWRAARSRNVERRIGR